MFVQTSKLPYTCPTHLETLNVQAYRINSLRKACFLTQTPYSNSTLKSSLSTSKCCLSVSPCKNQAVGETWYKKTHHFESVI